MNRHVKPRTMSAREFNQNTSGAKQAADTGPLIITDRGQPAYVLMTHLDYEKLSVPRKNLWDALTMDGPDDGIDLMDFIPPRRIEPLRDPFADLNGETE